MESNLKQEKFREFITQAMRFLFIILGFAFGMYYLGVGIYFAIQPSYFAYQTWFFIPIGICLIVGCIFGFMKAHHGFMALILIGLCVLAFFNLGWEPFLRESRILTAWTEFFYVLWIYMVLCVVGLLVGLIQLILSVVSMIKKQPDTTIKLGSKMASIVLIGIIMSSGIIALAVEENWFVGNQTITLYPGNYNIGFGGYGDINPDLYSTAARESMNRNDMLMIVHPGYWISYKTFNSTPNTWQDNVYNSTEYKQGKELFVNQTLYWKINYPNIKLICLVHGIPCGMATDYGVTNGTTGVGGTIWMMEEVMKTAVEYNLTNIMGVHTDQEDCADDWFPIHETTTRNRTRNEAGTQAYLDLIAWIKKMSTENSSWVTFFNQQKALYGQDHFVITTTYGSGQVVDGLDDDYDLDVFSLNNVLPIPYEEFLPMCYNQDAPTPDIAHYRLYLQMSVLKDVLHRKGYDRRIGSLLGVINEGIFNHAKTTTQWDGTTQKAATGYDVLLQQARIVKAFNASRVSFFIFHNCCGFEGFFDGYGDDVLDRMNETLNGPQGDQPFTILYRPEATFMERDMIRDLLLGGTCPIYIFYIGALVGALIIPILITQIKKRRKKTSQ